MKNRDIGHVFELGGTPSRDMVKRMAPSDSAHPIGLTTLLTDVLTVDEGVSGWGLKMAESGTFLLPLGNPVEIERNGWYCWIQRIEQVYPPSRGAF